MLAAVDRVGWVCSFGVDTGVEEADFPPLGTGERRCLQAVKPSGLGTGDKEGEVGEPLEGGRYTGIEGFVACVNVRVPPMDGDARGDAFGEDDSIGSDALAPEAGEKEPMAVMILNPSCEFCLLRPSRRVATVGLTGRRLADDSAWGT